jgi:hypothetical protein
MKHRTLIVTFAILIGLILALSACQEREEGCMNPYAVNFDPSADVMPEDVENGCEYYQLQWQWQHYSADVPNDTLLQFDQLTDAAGEVFYLESCNWLGGNIRLTPVGSGSPVSSPEIVLLTKDNSFVLEAEDNFFILSLNEFSTDGTGWVEVDTFNRLSFQLGFDGEIQETDPSKTTKRSHPLSVNASAYLYDSTRFDFKTLELVAVQPNNNDNRIEINLFDVFPFTFTYPIEVVDGQNTPIRVRLDYDELLDGIAFSTDPVLLIEAKIRQNIPRAFSVY